MWVEERAVSVAIPSASTDWVEAFSAGLKASLSGDETLLRFVSTESTDRVFRCETAVLSGAEGAGFRTPDNCLNFVRRPFEDATSFNAVLVVPTGIGAEIGGHAGDAAPVSKLLSSICDTVVTHPNVVNASDINEVPENCMYVEGSVLSRLLFGTIGLLPVRRNRILVVIDAHQDKYFTNAAINAVSAARAAYGLDCPRVLMLEPGIRLKAAYSSSQRAVGEVSNIENMLRVLVNMREDYDAVALSSVIDVPPGYHQQYFDSFGDMVNPWGGVEAMLTHTVSTLLNVQSAHSPMFEAREIANSDPGIVEPRMSAEAVSFTFMQCILKGLLRTPKIIDGVQLGHGEWFDVTDVSCIVSPDGCLGMPALAALLQGIPLIAVRENRNVMKNNLDQLPWKSGQFYRVENYWEAAGVMAALKAGIVPEAVRRPLAFTPSVLIDTKLDLRAVTAPGAASGGGNAPVGSAFAGSGTD